MHRLALGALALAVSLIEAPAFADSTPTETESRWYGWQTLAADATTLSLFIGTASDDRSGGVVPILGITGWVLGGPIVHMAHRQWGKAGLSGLLRLGVPLIAGGLYASSAGDCRDSLGDSYGCTGQAMGTIAVGALGVLLASAIDIAALSWEDAAR